jgi:hypothetical protein
MGCVLRSAAAVTSAANQIEGTIPPCLLASPTIQELYLSNNCLTGSLPAPPADSKLLIISAHSMVGAVGAGLVP